MSAADALERVQKTLEFNTRDLTSLPAWTGTGAAQPLGDRSFVSESDAPESERKARRRVPPAVRPGVHLLPHITLPVGRDSVLGVVSLLPGAGAERVGTHSLNKVGAGWQLILLR